MTIWETFVSLIVASEGLSHLTHFIYILSFQKERKKEKEEWSVRMALNSGEKLRLDQKHFLHIEKELIHVVVILRVFNIGKA